MMAPAPWNQPGESAGMKLFRIAIIVTGVATAIGTVACVCYFFVRSAQIAGLL